MFCGVPLLDLAIPPPERSEFDSLVARALNALLGRWENFWDPASCSAVVLASPADILEKTAYLLANPVAAGLVRHGKEWPGLWSPPEQIGTTIKVSRPVTPRPDEITLTSLTPCPSCGRKRRLVRMSASLNVSTTHSKGSMLASGDAGASVCSMSVLRRQASAGYAPGSLAVFTVAKPGGGWTGTRQMMDEIGTCALLPTDGHHALI